MPQDGGCLLLPIAPGPEGSCADLVKGRERGRREEERRKERRKREEEKREERVRRKEEKRGRREEEKRKERGRREGEATEEEEGGGGGAEEVETVRVQRYVLHRERQSQIDSDLLQGSLPMSVHKFMRGFTMMGIAMTFSIPGRSSGLRWSRE